MLLKPHTSFRRPADQEPDQNSGLLASSWRPEHQSGTQSQVFATMFVRISQNLARPLLLRSNVAQRCSLSALSCAVNPQSHKPRHAGSHTRTLHTTPSLCDSSFTNLLADDTPPAVQVSSISTEGIHLADGLLLPGPCFFLEGKVFLWDVANADVASKVRAERWREWNKEHFEILETVAPRPGRSC